MTLYVHGLGHAHPENEIDNRFLENLDIGTDDAWILERVGIRSRRTVLPLDYIRTTHNRDPRAALEAADCSQGDLGTRAAKLALARAGVAASEIGLVIGGNTVADANSCPGIASQVARGLDIEVPCFDVSSACTSFYAQLYVLAMMQPERLPDYVLIASPETMTTVTDYDDRSSAVLWGDAGVAAVLSTRHASRLQVLGNTLESSPAGGDKVTTPRGSHFGQEGRTVQMFGIKRMTRCIANLREQFEQEDRRFHFVGHQANLRMLEKVRALCEIPPDRHHTNVEWYGNTGSASSASVVSMQWDKWLPGDDVAIAGVGGGLTWSSYLLRFVGEHAGEPT